MNRITLRRWIVITNGVETRLVKTKPQLYANEVCVEVVINVPQPPRLIGSVEITLPDPPPAFAESTTVEYPEEAVTP